MPETFMIGGIGGGGFAFQSAEVGTVNSTTIAVTFNAPVSGSNYTDGVSIAICGNGVTVLSGTRQANHAVIYYVIDTTVVIGQAVSISYDAAAGNIVKENTTQVLHSYSRPVTNNVPDIAPSFVSGEVGNVDASTVVITFSEAITASDYTAGVTIKVNGSTRSITSGTRQTNHALVYYVLSSPVVFGNTITWEYAKASGNIVDEDYGTALNDVSAQSITNNVVNTSWWLTAGLSAADCVGAYQGKGAASYAASKVNLNNPGTHDLTDGVAPGWSAAGWAGDGATKFLISDIIPTITGQAWTMLAQWSGLQDGNSGNQSPCGMYNGGGTHSAFLIQVTTASTGNVTVYNGANFSAGTTVNTPKLLSGNYGFSDKTPVRNGAAESVLVPTATPLEATSPIYLLAINNDGSAAQFLNGTLIAVVIFNKTLTPTQYAAIASNMAGL